jgi:hypothetical protein
MNGPIQNDAHCLANTKSNNCNKFCFHQLSYRAQSERAFSLDELDPRVFAASMPPTCDALSRLVCNVWSVHCSLKQHICAFIHVVNRPR